MMSVWMMKEKGKEMFRLKNSNLTSVTDSGCSRRTNLTMFRCATAKDFYMGILNLKQFSAKRTMFQKATLF